MSKSLIKDTLRAIRNNFSRFVSIMLIVALGAAFFVGIKATPKDMFSTAEEYFSEYNLLDLRVQSVAGLTDSDVEAINGIDGIDYVSGQKFIDALVTVNGSIETDIDGTQISTRAYSISPADIANYLNGVNDGAYINRVELIEGRYPTAVNECLVDASELSTPESYTLGSTITLQAEGGDAPSELSTSQFTIVGIIRSPYYLSFERGNTNIGSGKIGTFIIIPEEAFTTDYYSEIYIKIAGSDSYDPYSQEYLDFVSSYAQKIEAISGRQINKRLTVLKPELENKIAEAEKKIKDKSDSATTAMEELDETIAQLQELVDNGKDIVAAAQAEFNSKFSAAENNLATNTNEYNAAIEKYNQLKKELDTKTAEYNTNYSNYVKSKEAYDTLYSQCTSASSKVDFLNSTITTTNQMIAAGEAVLDGISDSQSDAFNAEQIQTIITMMQTTYPELYAAVQALTTQGLAGEIVVNIKPYLDTQKAKLAQAEKEIKEQKAVLDALKAQLETQGTKLTQATQELANAKKELEAASNQLNSYYTQLQSAGYDIQAGALELEIERLAAQSNLNALIEQVNEAPDNLNKAKTARLEAEAQLTSALALATSELNTAKNLYNNLDSVTWSIYDRTSAPGYESYGQSVKNIEILSNLFPMLFFVVSSMICLTTLTRMVEEDRTVIGTYKALGYENSAIILKYLIYSFLAGFIGSVLGIAIGIFLFPFAINSAYSIMFSLPSLNFEFPWLWAFIGFTISMLCTAFTTLLALRKELRNSPSIIMRPKVPKAGKHILLEKVTFLWKRLNFTAKVTMRNLFRNKLRFNMSIIGITGSCALILASLGMQNSIDAIAEKQYGDNAIAKYDFQLIFDNPQTTDTHTSEFSLAEDDARVEALMLTAMKSMTSFSERSDKVLDVYVLVPENPEELNDYVALKNRQSGENYTLDDTGAIITEKLAKTTKTDVGDTISFEDSDGNVYDVKVSAIAENYTFSFIYMTDNLYKKVTRTSPVYNYAIGRISSSLKANEENLANVKGLLSTDIMKIDGITTIAYTADTTQQISEITDALSTVIIVFFVSALILAIAVLYNISNINVIERQKELATLKVLGFMDNEVSRYIYRENIFISVFGIIYGIILGIIVHYGLITFTAIDAVMYGQTIEWHSYILAVLITISFIVLVNIMLHYKIKKVDMVTSLKSVE
ncbi:MAG: FtsX-like permease family protein [Clostridia bacterium]|nr:FtsX-like permease family protein [Clostridia bacterium]MBR3976015.1 FtsX-like permease family protein [Clostridia bacterium]